MNWKEGDFTVKESESVTFKYREIAHIGSTEEAEIKKLYSKWTENLSK